MPSNPQYPGVYVQEAPRGVRNIAGVPTSVTAFIGTIPSGALNQPVYLASFVEFERVFGTPTTGCEIGYSVHQFFLNGGRDAWVVRIPDHPTEAQWLGGIRALDLVDMLSLLVLPGVTLQSPVAAAIAYCEKRRAFLILDSPREAPGPDEIRQRVERGEWTHSPNAGIYYPWLKMADPWNGGLPRLSPPSGSIAGLFARTDSTRGVWKAPAGAEAALIGVVALERQLADKENQEINRHGINCLRSFPLRGFVAWGSRTLAGDDRAGSEWKYIPTRRLALFVEESLYRGLKWAVFEPNDEPLWAQIRHNASEFMDGLFRQGAFQGSTPKDAYFVKCGAETTTQNDRNLGIVNIAVGFAPLKPAEFVILHVRQMAGQTVP